jgi:hypothetical protein
MRVRAFVVVALVGLVCVSGCGGGPTIVPVKGRVTYKGRPVANATVAFSPVQRSDDDLTPGKPGTGYTDADGYFVLSTYRPHDGAQVGMHNVRVSLDDSNPVRCKRDTRLTVEVKDEPNELNIELPQ